jgi:flagellar protein FlaJ
MVASAIVSKNQGVLGIIVILSLFVIIIPQFLIRYRKFREIKEMEEKFPTFLRDLIESIRAGLPFHKALISASKIQYGPLSKEISKMSNQLTWGIPLDKVLEQFSERVRSSNRMYVAIKIIRESHLSGGDVVSTLDSLVESQLKLIEVEKEKSSTLNQYVVLMYVITFIFLIIVVLINKFMIPIFEISQQVLEFGLTNPCNACMGMECSICKMFSGVSEGIFGIDPGEISSYYVAIFFFLAIIQSFFAGLVAGQISEGSWIAGMRHSLILVSITFGIFTILVYTGLLGG